MTGLARVRAYLPELAIAAASFLYGVTFAIVQDALEKTTPMGFNLLRFTVGAAVILPFALRRSWRGPAALPGDTRLGMIVGGASIGVIAALAYWTQNIGLERTTTSNSAFITGLFAVFAPLLEALVLRRWPRRGIVAAVAISIFGLFLLTGAQLSMNAGDAITLLTALGFGAWFVRIGMLATRFDVVGLTAAQIVTMAIVALPIAAVEGLGTVDASVWAAVLLTGIGCSAVAFALSIWAQRTIEPSRASILNLLEPVVAGVVGYLVGERLGALGYLGAALILAGILVAELGTHRGQRADRDPSRVPPAGRAS